MNNKALTVIAILAVIAFFLLRKKIVSAGTTLSVKADSAVPEQKTMIGFPLAPEIQKAIDNTKPDVYSSPAIPITYS